MPEVAKEARVGRPKSEEKSRAIGSAAAELFLAQGYQGTSMDAVARQAGVSKQTVYSHFANKEELFKACIRAKVAGYGFEETAQVQEGELRPALLTVCRRFVQLLFDPEVVAMHRVVMAEAASQPRIATLFFESGPRRTLLAVAAHLREQVATGRLSIAPERVHYAAVQLLNMAVGMYQLELLMGLRSTVEARELEAHLEHTVDDFLRLYGAGA